MKKMIVCILFAVALMSLCIGQKEVEEEPEPEQEVWSVEEWQEFLSFMYPPLGQDATNMIPAFLNVDNLPAGTRIVYYIESIGTILGEHTIIDTKYSIVISGAETVNGIECTVLDVAVESDMSSMGEVLKFSIEGREWIDRDGTPVKLEQETVMFLGEYEIPISSSMERIGEEELRGHDCWVFSGPQTTTVLGEAVEGTITEYLDKESSSVVRVITEVGDQKEDTGFMEPPAHMEELEWELGKREGVSTEMGVYDCQIIYLKREGRSLGTLWASEKVKVPVKFHFSYKSGAVDMILTMTLMEYMLGT